MEHHRKGGRWASPKQHGSTGGKVYAMLERTLQKERPKVLLEPRNSALSWSSDHHAYAHETKALASEPGSVLAMLEKKLESERPQSLVEPPEKRRTLAFASTEYAEPFPLMTCRVVCPSTTYPPPPPPSPLALRFPVSFNSDLPCALRASLPLDSLRCLTHSRSRCATVVNQGQQWLSTV